MRVIRIRQGFNPNSSSLSVNMAVLLAATGAVTAGTFLLATAIRLLRREKAAPAAPAPTPPAPEPKP